MPSADYKVEIVDSSGEADMSVTVIGDQVVDLTGATDGQVLTVQSDGTVAPESLPTPALHVVGGVGEPAFAHSWVNFGDPWLPAQFSKDAFGYVHIDGLVKDGTLGQTVFVLPAGFRPAKSVMRTVDSNGALGVVWIGADGGVIANTGDNTYFSLGLSFRAA